MSTRSNYSSNGLEVSIDWNEPTTPNDCCLIAHVVMPDSTRIDRIEGKELSYILHTAAKAAIATGEPDHKHYARIYWGMIL